MGKILSSSPRYIASYGIYSVGDYNFFPGVVAAINSLRSHGYDGPIAVADVGFHPWMQTYLADYQDVYVLDVTYLKHTVRFTDLRSPASAILHGYAYKAFAIAHFNLFESFTFIDGDYLPLTNLELELRPLADAGHFVSTKDGHNTWDERHLKAVGVRPGRYVNINAGFFSLSMRHFAWLIHEWCHLMTRRRPFDLWYADQGALNAVLDKYGVEKTAFDQELWNQTWLNQAIKNQGLVTLAPGSPPKLIYRPTGQPVKGWHGWGWHKPWHYLGIDEYRRTDDERERFRSECRLKIPEAAVDVFAYHLFSSGWNSRLQRANWRIVPG